MPRELKKTDHPPLLWTPDPFRQICRDEKIPFIELHEVQKRICLTDIIESHNIEFEAALWEYVMAPRYNVPDLPVSKLRCSAAKAAMMALPRSLEECGKVLRSPVQKDKAGYGLIQKLSVPQKDGTFCEDPKLLAHFFRYCLQDTNAERHISKLLRDLPPKELEIFQLNFLVNKRGLHVDVAAANTMIEMTGLHTQKLLAEFAETTKGAVASPRQAEKLKQFLDTSYGMELDDLTKGTVKEALEKEGDPF